MTKLILFLALFLTLPFVSSAHGVAVVNAQDGTILRLTSSTIAAEVTNQVARVVTTQVFKNNLGAPAAVTYAFPMHADASAIQLRWNTGAGWKYAIVQSGPQDPLPGGGGGQNTDATLAAYLGDHALQFNPQETLLPDSTITFELTYVELLPYKFNKVSFQYPNNYHGIQADIIETIQFNFTLHSGRSITAIDLLSHTATSSSNDGHLAELHYATGETSPQKDIEISYELASNELGLLDMSTQLPDSVAICDSFGSGFLTLVIEPESNTNTQVIQKNFVLVIDHSGSMSSENKMAQARDASSFIVQNLNPADHFNIISFDESITLFKPELVEYNATTEGQALDFISNQNADGSTNISGSLTTAINQFSVTDQGQANIILFFTDGQPTAGITSASGILQAVTQAAQVAETDIFLFAFGIGSDVNKSLLTQLATTNSGLAEFLGASELAEKITEFFLYVNNPVLLNTQISFDPPLVSETWPDPLPNLYKGQQLILSGRYSQPGPVTVTLTGKAFNAPVSYQYNINLADTTSVQYQFLPKLWAKSKIGALTTDYYISGDTNLLNAITDISNCYGVISDFTSFHENGGGTPTATEEARREQLPRLEALPNPSHEVVLLRLPQAVQNRGGAYAYVFDVQGHLLRTINLAYGQTVFSWDGLDASGNGVPAGVYFVAVVDGERVTRGQVVRM